MAQASQGNTVKVHYTGRLNDGTVFDSSAQREPLEFKVGDGNIIPGFEKAVVGMEIGQSKTVVIPSDQAYGARRDELVLKVDKSEFPEEISPQIDQQLQLRQPDGHVVVVTVTDVQEDQVTLDANHPLAGQDLTFDIEVVEIS